VLFRSPIYIFFLWYGNFIKIHIKKIRGKTSISVFSNFSEEFLSGRHQQYLRIARALLREKAPRPTRGVDVHLCSYMPLFWAINKYSQFRPKAAFSSGIKNPIFPRPKFFLANILMAGENSVSFPFMMLLALWSKCIKKYFGTSSSYFLYLSH
jgi:hypothetical protein